MPTDKFTYSETLKEWDAQDEQLKKEGKWDPFLEMIGQVQRSRLAHAHATEEFIKDFSL